MSDSRRPTMAARESRSGRLRLLALLMAVGVVFGSATGVTAAQPDTSSADSCTPNSRSARDAGNGKASFDIPAPGIASSVWDDGTIGLVVPIENTSERSADAARLTRIKVSNADTVEPAAFPVELGDISPHEIAHVNVQVADRDGTLNSRYRVTVQGRYTSSDPGCTFTVAGFVSPRASDDDDTFEGQAGQVHVQDPREVSYPPPQETTFSGFNAESPILIPPGPDRQLFERTPTPSESTAPAGAPLDINRNRNSTSTNAGTPPDPNAARGTDDVVLTTWNTGISFSTDGGDTFTDVNLFAPVPGQPGRTTFFPQSDAGLCCDQIVTYVPEQNLFVWLLQYTPVSTTTSAPGGGTTTTITQPNRQRIAWATPQAIKDDFFDAWTYGDLTATAVSGVSSGLGVASNEWLDYPDLAYSGDYLYVGTDRGFPDSPGLVYTGRRIVARLDLADMADPAATVVNYDFTEYSGSNGLNKTHFVQGAPDRMVVAGLDNTSTLRVFTWPDDAGTAFVRTLGISSITTTYTSTAPDGTDWYANSFPGNISGATYRDGEYVFAFNGGVDSPDRPRAFVRLETVTADEFAGIPLLSVSEEYDIWNSDYAFAMAALGTQADEIGLVLAVGGGTIGYPQFAVGYKDDFFVQTVTTSDAVQPTRFGDYLSVRPIPGSLRFAAAVYDTLQTPAGGTRAAVRYVEFGRPEQAPF